MAYVPITTALRSVLVANAGIITKALTQKIFPQKLPQNTVLPAISYLVVADIPTDDIAGNAGLFRAIVEYKAWAKTEKEAAEIVNIVRLALQGYRGVPLDVKIQGIHYLHEHGDFESEVIDYSRIARFSVWYKRLNPGEEEEEDS